MIALLESYKSGAFQSKTLLQNIIAGAIVGVITLPLSMAFAIASGATPEQGIYTSIIAGFVVAVFGGTRYQITGPTGAFVVVLYAISAQYGFDGLQVATLMAGFIMVFMGVVRLGGIIKFIPDPVIIGFTTGIAIVVFVGQWRDFFGLQDVPKSLIYFHQKIVALFFAMPSLNFKTTLLGVCSLLVLFGAPKVKYLQRFPGAIVALVFGTFFQATFQLSDIATVGTVYGQIPSGLPSFDLPELSLTKIITLVGPAFTIALLGAIESLLSAVIADGMMGTKHNSNQELIGQGIANIICPFFGGFASTGAISRTATSVRHGATNPIAAIVHCLFLLIVVYYLVPLAYYIPLCTLAAILFSIAYNMCDMKHFIYLIRHAPKNDVFILILTFFLTIVTDLVVAVNVGVILSVLLFTQRMSQSVTIEAEESEKIAEELKAQELPPETVVYTIQGPFFFGAVERLEHTFEVINEIPKVIIFRLKGVPFIDLTGLESFQEILKDFQGKGTKVLLCEANKNVKARFIDMGTLKLIYKESVFDSLKQAINAIDH